MHDKIVVRDRQDVIEIGFADIEKVHGYSNIAGAAVGFKALQAACGALFPGLPAARAAMAVVSGHPGSGVRDAIETVTRAHTRDAYTVDTPGRRRGLTPIAICRSVLPLRLRMAPVPTWSCAQACCRNAFSI